MLVHDIYVPPSKVEEVTEWCKESVGPDDWMICITTVLGDGRQLWFKHKQDVLFLKLKFNL